MEIGDPPAKYKSTVWKLFGFPKYKEGLQNETSERSTSYRRTLIQYYTLNQFPSLASEKKCIREYIFVFATLYSRYESYSSLGVFVPALVNKGKFIPQTVCLR